MISLSARKLMQAARRGCCHLLHPLKQEVIRDAQIAATVQVFGRQSPHDQPFCKEADASCEARLLPSVAPFEAGSVSGMHRLRQPCRSLEDRVLMISLSARKLMQAARRGLLPAVAVSPCPKPEAEMFPNLRTLSSPEP